MAYSRTHAPREKAEILHTQFSSVITTADPSEFPVTNYERFKDALGANIKENPLFLIGTRHQQVIMAKLRMRCSNLNSHLQSMHIVKFSACSCGFVNEDEFHFFFGCILFNRPRIILQNVISSVAPFTLRTLLYGVDEFDFTENKKIINETLKFIHEAKRFE